MTRRAGYGFRRHWHWLLLGGLVLYFCLDVAVGRGWLIFVPRERDSRLVGRWAGVWTGPGWPVPRTLTFTADGAWGEGKRSTTGPRRSTWGTKDGRLHVKWLATDYWDGKSFPYSVSKDGRVLRLDTLDRYGYLFPKTLRRQEESSGRRAKGRKSGLTH